MSAQRSLLVGSGRMPDNPLRIKVSSVLNKDTKNFGKQHLVDGSDETCWNSDQGSPQWVSVEFENSVNPTSLVLVFQGGFAGRECEIFAQFAERTWESLRMVYPQDSNMAQSFDLWEGNFPQSVSGIKIVFHNSSDTYGRITLYKLDIVE
ncbi:galactose-binding domain-like protein [Zopfochytrium polystomum]|nr:galactose-binding domain-like protein [Zopfochytrium polystomum]